MKRRTDCARRSRSTRRPRRGAGERARSTWQLAAAVFVMMLPTVLAAAPIRMRLPEGPSHGFVALFDSADKQIAHGELTQWLEHEAVANQLVIHFDDGSVYDERLRFEQRAVFRLLSYKLEQRGPSFSETAEIEFDGSGKYRVRLRSAPDKEEEQDSGTFEVPDDLYNGMTSTLLKNLMPDSSAITHLVAFTPKPRLLVLHIKPEHTDHYWVGPTARRAKRFLMEPKVTGAVGVVATVLGKQPPIFRMWMAEGKAPILVRFAGPLYAEGPQWRIEIDGPRWKR